VKTYNLYIPRIARVVAAGHPHHITQRGNYRQKIFADNTDRRKYLFPFQGGMLALSPDHISLLSHVKAYSLYGNSPKRRFHEEGV